MKLFLRSIFLVLLAATVFGLTPEAGAFGSSAVQIEPASPAGNAANFAVSQPTEIPPVATLSASQKTLDITGFLGPRYLNPETGRFWTRDVFEGTATDPLTLHKYLYASDDPIGHIDPAGLMTLAELSQVSGEIGNRSKQDAAKARTGVKNAQRVLCSASYGTGKALHHILPVFAGPKRTGGVQENLSELGDSVWHTDLHTLIRRTLQFAGLPAPEIGKVDYVDLLKDPKKRQIFIAAMRYSYTQWDKKCSPPAPSLLADFNELVAKENWNSL